MGSECFDPTMKKPTLVYNISGMDLTYGFVLENSGVRNTCLFVHCSGS